MAQVLASLGSQGAFVVHGHGGLDELTTTGLNRVSALKNGEVQTYVLDPAELGFPPADSDDLRGGDAFENARITRAILAGDLRGPKRDTVVLNAGAALAAAGRVTSIADGVALAEHSLDAGLALRTLDRLVEYSRTEG
jgi:anthranilate phosphoribosyltransferase